MKIMVEVHASTEHLNEDRPPLRCYTMDHDDQAQRRVLGEQCRNAFEAGQCIVTIPLKD
ncbi:MAG: hypothetical protein J0L89_08790 [Xanthomonadales bacterium]|nr:hypothetical protein [Xanthomonadales bacterium]